MDSQQMKEDVKAIVGMTGPDGRVNGYLPTDVLTAYRLGISVVEVVKVMEAHNSALIDLSAVRDKFQ